MIMLPFGLHLCYKTFYLTFNYVSLLRRITYVIAILQFIFLICINYYWYYKILRILKKAFCSPASVDEDDGGVTQDDAHQRIHQNDNQKRLVNKSENSNDRREEEHGAQLQEVGALNKHTDLMSQHTGQMAALNHSEVV